MNRTLFMKLQRQWTMHLTRIMTRSSNSKLDLEYHALQVLYHLRAQDQGSSQWAETCLFSKDRSLMFK